MIVRIFFLHFSHHICGAIDDTSVVLGAEVWCILAVFSVFVLVFRPLLYLRVFGGFHPSSWPSCEPDNQAAEGVCLNLHRHWAHHQLRLYGASWQIFVAWVLQSRMVKPQVLCTTSSFFQVYISWSTYYFSVFLLRSSYYKELLSSVLQLLSKLWSSAHVWLASSFKFFCSMLYLHTLACPLCSIHAPEFPHLNISRKPSRKLSQDILYS